MRNTIATALTTLSTASFGPTVGAPGAQPCEPGEPQFVFVTRDGRIMARQADGSVTDMTPIEAVCRPS